MKNLHILTGALLCVLSPAPSCSFPFWRSRLDPIPESSTDNVECFLDYMELWVPRRQMDGLLLWLSRVMRFPVSLSSLDRSNHLISRCRYALDMDSNGNFIFRVHYSACNVQTQNGFHVLEIHLLKKTSSGEGRSDRYLMRCPALTAAMGREKVRCDPNYVQVSRPMPLENADDQDWFLLFRGELVVSVEDASLIGVEVEMNKSCVTVKGLRDQLLSPKEFLNRQMDVLPLWFGHRSYAYSLEASCPLVTQSPGEEVIVHIPKQRMGLVKRGSYITETLTLRNIVVKRPITVTVTENKHFVMMNIPATDILQTQDCTIADNRQGVQVFYSIDLVLEFAEIAYPMNWTLENYYECTVLTPDTAPQETLPKNNEKVESSANNTVNGTMSEETNVVQSHGKYPLSSGLDPSRFIITTSTVKSRKATVVSVKSTGTFIEGSGEDLDISGSGDQEMSSDEKNATQLADLGNTMVNSSIGSITLVTKQPNILNLLSAAPSRFQDKHSKISNNQLSNSTTVDEPKNIRVLSKISSTMAPTTFPVETGGKNKTLNMKTSQYEDTRWKMVHSAVTKVIENGGSVTYSAVNKQEDSTKPMNSQLIPSSEKKSKDDADLWEVLIGDTLFELLAETARDGLISPVYRHNPSRRSETGSSERIENQRVLDNTQEKMMDETSVPSVRHKRPARDLQHSSQHHTDEDSRHTDWTMFNSLHEDTLYNTTSEVEIISSAEQLIMEK